jgi:hypothetical protein
MGRKKGNSSSARIDNKPKITLESKKAKLAENQAKLEQSQKNLQLKETKENITKFKLQKKEEETELSSNFTEEGQKTLLLKFPGYQEHFDKYVTNRSVNLLERMPVYNAEYMKGNTGALFINY